MRRWLIIILLLVYPFQVTLAMVDGCCVTTSAGISHHSASKGANAFAAQPEFVADDSASTRADPHCPACVFGQVSGVPFHVNAVPAVHHRVSAVHTPIRILTSVPARRPERPKWPAAA
jgi:hypothetical protein